MMSAFTHDTFQFGRVRLGNYEGTHFFELVVYSYFI